MDLCEVKINLAYSTYARNRTTVKNRQREPLSEQAVNATLASARVNQCLEFRRVSQMWCCIAVLTIRRVKTDMHADFGPVVD